MTQKRVLLVDDEVSIQRSLSSLLRSRGYAVESEMLIKAANRRARLAQVPIRVIYEGNVSHYQPIRDTSRIALWSIYFKAFDEPETRL